jgi:Planctomycete cytochrome C
MKVRFTATLAAVTVLSAVAVVGTGIELQFGPACAAQPNAPRVSFSDDILPLLQFRCSSCHHPGGEGYEKSGLDLTSYQGVMKGTKYGPMVIPGHPETSNLMLLLDWRVPAEVRMPHGTKQLSICDRDEIRTWIFDGAKDN